MPVPINYFAVLVAAIASMVIGFLWYGPIFGKQWIALSGMNPTQMDKIKPGGMSKTYLLAFIGSLLISYVLAHAIIFAGTYMHVEGINLGLTAGFFNWLGFIAPVSFGSVLWEQKPWKLWFIDNSYHLVTLMVMGIILALWK